MYAQKFKKIMGIMLLISSSVQAAPWVACGTLGQLTVANRATLPGKPLASYEYGITYNSSEPMPIITTSWNVGLRIYNKSSYLVETDNPELGMLMGGFIFYSGTQATDDNCGSGNWRHHYWNNDPNNQIILLGGNGCYGATGASGNLPIYCRLR
jgi:hypothetical protein